MREAVAAVSGAVGLAAVATYYVSTHAWRRAEQHCAVVDAQIAELRALRGAPAAQPPPEVRGQTFERRLRNIAANGWNDGVWGIYEAVRQWM